MTNKLDTVPVAHAGRGDNHSLRTLFDRHFSVELAFTREQIDEALSLRYQVYCVEHPFEDASCFPDGREHDAYDYRAIHALVRHRASQDCAATVRLVLPDKDEPRTPFPIEAHCGEAIPPGARAMLDANPRTRVAEVSRFAVSREFRQRMGEGAQISGVSDQAVYSDPDGQRMLPYVSVALFAAVLRISAGLGITHWMGVMEPTLLRLLKRYGIGFPHVGHTVNYHGRRKPAFAEAMSLVDNMHAMRPDVWSLITDSGAIKPVAPQPLPANTRGHDVSALATAG